MRFQGKNFVVYKNLRSQGKENGPIVVVGVKISKKAVSRNRLKRQVREILRDYKKKAGDLARGLKIVALPPALRAQFFELKQDLNDIFKKIR